MLLIVRLLMLEYSQFWLSARLIFFYKVWHTTNFAKKFIY